MAQAQQTQKRKKMGLNLIELCVDNNPEECLSILKDFDNCPKLKTKTDLVYRLANAYNKSDDKVGIEKRLASIHPHKDFIMRYNSIPAPKIDNEVSVEGTAKEVAKATDENVKSNCAGNPNCSCNQSNFSADATQQTEKTDHSQLIIAVLGITAVFGMALIYKK